MANNRMYLVNQRTGQRIFLAKYYPSTGWFIPSEKVIHTLRFAFDVVDFGHLTQAQRAENEAHHGLGAPHLAFGGMYGDRWDIEYDEEPLAAGEEPVWEGIPLKPPE